MSEILNYFSKRMDYGNIETDKLIQKTIDLSQRVNRVNGSINEFLIISDFGSSSIRSNEGFVKPYFRIFEPVKAEEGRKLSKEYDSTFNASKDSGTMKAEELFRKIRNLFRRGNAYANT